MATETEEAETDVAELVCALAEKEVRAGVFDGISPSEVQKQQFRDALNKLIDERVATALRKTNLQKRRAPGGGSL